MSDLAPFVAAAIRDRVVEEMAKEIDDLKEQKEEELAPWLVVIHGPGPPDDDDETVTVYAWARISMKDVLTQTLSPEDGTNPNRYVDVRKFNTTDNIVRLDNFLSCSVSIICNRASSTGDDSKNKESSHRVSFDGDEANIGRGCGLTDEEGQSENMRKDFWFQWWYFSESDVVAGFEVAMPIAPENQDRVTDELIADIWLVRDNVLDFADDVAGGSAPIRFLNMTLKAQGLVSLLNGDGDSNEDDGDENDNSDVDAMSVEE